MQIELPIREGLLVRRYKRFLADVEVAGELLTAHCPNPGSMLGVQPAGARVVLRDSQNAARKLRYTFQTIEIDGTWVNVDTQLANGVVEEGVTSGAVAELAGYPSLRREVAYGENSRIDLLLERGSDDSAERCYVEVKSTTLAQGGRAFFPDAVTARGKKHLEELERMVVAGHRAVIFFSIARDDVEAFAPASKIDPAYAQVLRRAVAAGVEALAYTSIVTPDSLRVGRRVPIELDFDDGPSRAPAKR
jgi:sugar fermentation stimulation protein A